MNRFADVPFLPASVIPGHQNIHADGKSHKHIDQKVDQGAGGAYGRQGLAPGEPPDHDHIGGIKQKLQDSA